ncbi:major facilitator superfamily domain-containing protein [Kockovaella imperatae]|uniref:Major facilitator superfamily domain-containing protein n=1 Tax=Kockovaella imperatae TaxID=4999 RepID=A0A1Y1UP71_9TREE|nr:major facilitator superfamily domain-containing protein [Kockovaella imperatae]ORX39802.1 major facilitator superfamily domain-containing protein [Kockovaella imperatae]
MSAPADSIRSEPLPLVELLAAEESFIPPRSIEPLATTAEDVDGLEYKSGHAPSTLHHQPHDGQSDVTDRSTVVPIGEPPLGDVAPKLSTTRRIVIAAAATSAVFLSAGGSVALNIALPTIQRDLGMTDGDLQWVISAFSLTNGCFLLLAGRMADIHGRKLVFLVGIGWYTLWTLVGGWMKDGAGLVVTRALAGSGSAMSIPAAVGIIASNFEGRARATAFATFAAGAPVGAGLGMTLGGLLVTYASTTWRAVLWVTAGIAFVVFTLGLFTFPTDVITTTDKRLDWVGAALVTVGLILLQFVISDGEGAPLGWKTPYIIALLVISIFMLVAFFFWEKYITSKSTRPPLMRLQLWTRANGRLAAVYMIGCVSWMGFTALSFHATLFYQQAQELSPLQALVRFLPMPIMGILCNAFVGIVIARVPTQLLVCVGILLTGVSNVLFATAPVDGSYWGHPFNAMWSTVVGADFLMATGQLFVSRLALPEEQSLAGGLFQTLVQLGGAFGLALTSVVASVYQSKSLAQGKSSNVAFVHGLHAAFWLGAGMSFAALGIAVVALRGMGTIGKSHMKGDKGVKEGQEPSPVVDNPDDEEKGSEALDLQPLSKVSDNKTQPSMQEV